MSQPKTLEILLQIVAEEWGFARKETLVHRGGSGNTGSLVLEARRVAMFLSLRWGLSECKAVVAQWFGYRDQATVDQAVEAIEDKLKRFSALGARLAKLKRTFDERIQA